MAQETDVNAQTQQSPAETVEQANQAGQGQVAPEGQSSGVQKRIDELTAEKWEAKRRADAIQQQLADSQAQLAKAMEIMANNQQVQAVASPVDNLDPEARKAIEALVQSKVKGYQAQVQEMSQALERQEFATKATGEHPDVVARANQLFLNWQRQGASGFKMIDALVYARGEMAGQDLSAATRARNERGQFAASASNVASAQSAPPPPAVRTSGLPADLSQRPLDEQIALLEKHLDGKSF